MLFTDPTEFPADEQYPGLSDRESGPTFSVVSVAASPLALLFYLMPEGLWRRIARVSNRYNVQQLAKRFDRLFENQGGDSTRTRDNIFRMR